MRSPQGGATTFLPRGCHSLLASCAAADTACKQAVAPLLLGTRPPALVAPPSIGIWHWAFGIQSSAFVIRARRARVFHPSRERKAARARDGAPAVRRRHKSLQPEEKKFLIFRGNFGGHAAAARARRCTAADGYPSAAWISVDGQLSAKQGAFPYFRGVADPSIVRRIGKIGDVSLFPQRRDAR